MKIHMLAINYNNIFDNTLLVGLKVLVIPTSDWPCTFLHPRHFCLALQLRNYKIFRFLKEKDVTLVNILITYNAFV